ncbi:TVP38/TMEM64 family protein [Mangrovibacillus cuniculi]|uniref:TVP38/TMEM64 family membrane protein n=1 Tax=Mangrovibacillus cuniculi TaxID=2593652 RepID=A0A7S8HER6_9BACI|nr:VTT domain-containing protein [Mangrovibacillus cuniculi]QPC45665.1 VTT domain-containing protein [Mangrovibacillus cuniculi]
MSILEQWTTLDPILVAIISILMNIIVSILGVVPSTFVTLGTVSALGVQASIPILIIGEALGAMASFILYRKGINLFREKQEKPVNNKFLRIVRDKEGAEAFFAVIILRLLPFVPSGLVALTAAFSKMGFLSFTIATTIGKIPSLFLEVGFVTVLQQLPTYLYVGTLVLLLVVSLLSFKAKRN